MFCVEAGNVLESGVLDIIEFCEFYFNGDGALEGIVEGGFCRGG